MSASKRGRAFEYVAALSRPAGLDLHLSTHCEGEPLIVLVVGSDARVSLPRRLRRLRADVEGRRADAIGLLVVAADGNVSLERIPRDAFVAVPGVGHQRVGWALGYGGPQCLVDAVRSATEIPVHHFIEIGFVAFSRLVTALGGLPPSIAAGRIDHRTGLDSTKLFKLRLTGRDALALARSRTPAGRRPEDDLARIELQSHIVVGLVARATRLRLVIAALVLLPRLGHDLFLDDRWTAKDLDRLYGALARRSLAVRAMPVREREVGGGVRSPFTPNFDSSSPVLELEQLGVDELRRLALPVRH